MSAKNFKTVILPAERMTVLSNAKLYDEVSKYDVLHIEEVSKDMVEAVKKADTTVNAIDEQFDNVSKDNIDELVEAYDLLRKVNSFTGQRLDLFKAVIKQNMLDNHVQEVESDKHLVKFSLSKPTVKIEYDVDKLKQDQPDLYKELTHKAGKPMKVKDRKELDKKAEDLKQQLLEVNKQIAEDNAAREVIFSEDLFEKKLENDESLKIYKKEIETPRKFYFKEMKAEK